jgi:phage gpG-like protein
MITGYLTGDREVVARLKGIPPKTRDLLLTAVAEQAVNLQGYIKTSKRSGDPLNRRSGTLSRSINVLMQTGANEITASVGTNVEYAAIHEFGGTVTVREHIRRQTQVFGRELSEPIEVTVRAHPATYPERSFLRSALLDKALTIRRAFSEVLSEAIKP